MLVVRKSGMASSDCAGGMCGMGSVGSIDVSPHSDPVAGMGGCGGMDCDRSGTRFTLHALRRPCEAGRVGAKPSSDYYDGHIDHDDYYRTQLEDTWNRLETFVELTRGDFVLIIAGDLNTEVESQPDGQQLSRRGSSSRAPWRVHLVADALRRLGVAAVRTQEEGWATTRPGRIRGERDSCIDYILCGARGSFALGSSAVVRTTGACRAHSDHLSLMAKNRVSHQTCGQPCEAKTRSHHPAACWSRTSIWVTWI